MELLRDLLVCIRIEFLKLFGIASISCTKKLQSLAHTIFKYDI